MRHVDLEAGVGAARRGAVPEPVDEGVERHDGVGVQRQQGEQGPLLRRAEIEGDLSVVDGDRPQQRQAHGPECRSADRHLRLLTRAGLPDVPEQWLVAQPG